MQTRIQIKGKRLTRIVIDPCVAPEYKLNELLKGVTSKNTHAEVETGGAVGKEIWAKSAPC